MRVRVRFFAALREIVGQDEAVLELSEGSTCEDVWSRLVEEFPALGSRRKTLTAAVNRRYAPFNDPLQDGDEIVFIPPVSGG
jgi:molybdopterin converting factor subunit 1